MAKKKYPSNITDPAFDTAAYSRDLTQTLMTEMFKIISLEQKTYGAEFAHGVVMNFLASYVATVVLNSLKSGSQAPTQEAQLELATELYSRTKSDIEDAIATAFSKAFTSFDPNSAADYQCDITCLDTGYDDHGPTH